jgi:hypothetical protein
MTFLLNEDAALKTLLKNRVKVSDAANNSRSVGVWFRQPDLEIREQSYPYLTIEMVDISESRERRHSGLTTLPYVPDGTFDTNGNALRSDIKYLTETPIPVDIDYQVASYSRHPHHDRQIISTILTQIMPFRYGVLKIPEDGTVRRLELTGYAKRDMTEQGKRLFVNVFSIRINSEIFTSGLMAMDNPVDNIRYTGQQFTNEDITQTN